MGDVSPEWRGQAGRASVALDGDLRALVAVHFAAGGLQCRAGPGVAVHNDHASRSDRQDVAAHRLVLPCGDWYHPDAAVGEHLHQSHGRQRRVDHGQVVGQAVDGGRVGDSPGQRRQRHRRRQAVAAERGATARISTARRRPALPPRSGPLAVEAGKHVAWFTLEQLGVIVRAHRSDDSVTRAITRILRADVVVVDDIGLLPVGPDPAEDLYRLVDAAYEKRSVAVSSNLHPSGFDELMPKTLATATVDRLM